MGNIEFVTVKVQIGNQTKTIKMQKGTSFKNKGGIFTADKDGATVKMTNYQIKVFEAVANNVKEKNMGDGIVLSADDIKLAQQKFKQGGFVADMSEFLPEGYKIERPKMSTNDKYIEAYVTNGKESQSATLRFAYGVNSNNSPTSTNPAQNNTTWKMPTTVDKECLNHLDPDGNGKFELNNDYENPNIPFRLAHEKFENKLKALNGQKITPEFIDKLVNTILDMAKNDELGELTYEGDGSWTTCQELADISKFAQYLKPTTVNKLLNQYNVVSPAAEIDDKIYFKNIKNLYSRLNANQRQKYYQNVLSQSSNTDSNVYAIDNRKYQTDGKITANLIYETPLSSATYTKLKNFVMTMNKPGNGITRTKTECKKLINILLSKHQITQQQANELLKAGNIQQ